MVTRREALSVLASMSAGTLLATRRLDASGMMPALGGEVLQGDGTPPLAPGAPTSPERMALIEAFRRKIDGIEQKFEARSFKGDWEMPYRLFRPEGSGKLPLVLYLHGSGGMGTDNAKQLGLGNVFGTRVWALPENQKNFPCYVVVPQTDRGWINYGPPAAGDSIARVIPGLGDGARLALNIVDALSREFNIDQQRIYVAGQSMGGGGVWHLTAQRPRFFAAAAICCGSPTSESATESATTPLWNFHGVADTTVAVSISRDRIDALRKAGSHPLYTEYAGVNHNVWEWAFTEPSLLRWVFSQRRAT